MTPRVGAWRTVGLVIAVLALLTAVVITRDTHRTTRRIAVATQEVLGTAAGELHRGVSLVAQGADFMVSMVQAQRESERLKQALSSARFTILRERAAALEERQLRSALDLRQRLSLPTVAAEVTGLSPASWWDELTIDRGTAEGVRVGSPVLAPSGVVGRVLMAGRHSATVLLLADAQSGVGAEDARTGALGVLLGGGEPGRVTLDLFSSSAKVAAGDRVVTSGIGGTFASGLALGSVQQVVHAASGLVTAGVKLAADPSSVTVLLVVKGSA